MSELDIGTFVQKMFEDKLKEPVRINCGLVGFTVRGGVAAADPILIDTSKNVILGRGGFSFRTEGVDLAIRADGKKFSLFSGQSPVGIGARSPTSVIPAKAGIHGQRAIRVGAQTLPSPPPWIPASAGMTGGEGARLQLPVKPQ